MMMTVKLKPGPGWGVFFILNFAWASQRNNNENIGFRNSYISGEIKEDQGNGKYNIEIAGSEEGYPNIFTVHTDPTYAAGDRVGILWEKGNRQRPVAVGTLRDTIYIEVTSTVNSLGI